MALNPLDEIRTLGAPEALGGGAPPGMGGGMPGMGGGMPDMGGGMPDMGGGPPIPGGPPMGGSMPIDPGVGADAMASLMGEELVNGDILAEDAALGEEASTDEAATQVAFAIVEMAPSGEEAMNLTNAIRDKVASMVMEEDMDIGGGEDRLLALGGPLHMQFGGTVPPARANPFTMPQQYGQQSWTGAQGQGGSGPMGPPIGGGFQAGGPMTQGYNARLDESLGARNRGPMLQNLQDRRNESKGMERAMGKPAYSAVGSMDRSGIGSLMMNRGGEPTMAGGRPIQWQQGPVGQQRRQDFMNYMAPGQARRQLGRQAAAGGPGRAATSGIGMWRGGEPTMAGGRPIQWQQGPVGQQRKADYMSYVAPGAARRQLGRQAAAGGPGRFAGRGAGGG
jgi:hypothetical protein